MKNGRSRAVRRAALFALLAGLTASFHARCASHDLKYSVIDRWKLGGSGQWDMLAVDSASRRLYICRSDRVDVIDADSGKTVGIIPGTDGVHGIALAADLGRGFITNGKKNSIGVFDLKTLKPIGEVNVDGQGPDTILYEPWRQRLYTLNARTSTASVFDAKNFAPVGIVPFSGKPEFAVSDGRGRVYVNVGSRSVIAVVDAATLQVVATWLLAPCQQPTGLALDNAHHRLFSACSNQQLAVTDSTNGKHIASVPIGILPDGAEFDPASGMIFTSNGEGTLSILHEDDPGHFRVVDNLATQKSARTMALDTKTHRVFLAASEYGPSPRPTRQDPHPQPGFLKNGFMILVAGPAPAP